MDIYNYDSKLHFYTGQSLADPSPVVDGGFIVPAFATNIAPPEAGAMEIAVFEDGAWQLVEDWRGIVLYSTVDGREVHITDLGPKPPNTTPLQPMVPDFYWENGTWQTDHTRNLARATAAIKAERDRRMSTGGYQADGYWFHSDQHSRSQQLALVLIGDNLPDNIEWRTMSGDYVTMTPELAQQILAAAVANETAIFSVAEEHIAALEDVPMPTEYDYSANWPTSFEEFADSHP
jgi:hypothetical protein